MSDITALMQQTWDTGANWSSKNPWLYIGQWGVVFDPATPAVKPRVKMGMGLRWNDTPFFGDEGTSSGEYLSHTQFATGADVIGTVLTLEKTARRYEVILNGKEQNPKRYTPSGNTLTFDEAVPAYVEIWVKFYDLMGTVPPGGGEENPDILLLPQILPFILKA